MKNESDIKWEAISRMDSLSFLDIKTLVEENRKVLKSVRYVIDNFNGTEAFDEELLALDLPGDTVEEKLETTHRMMAELKYGQERIFALKNIAKTIPT